MEKTDESVHDSSKQLVGEKLSNVKQYKQDKERNSIPRGNKKGYKRKLSMDKSNFTKKRKMYEVGKRLSEVDIGATEFISEYEGFSGIVKDKYSDFHVHEISCDGSITKLTSFNIPKEEVKTINIKELMESLPEDVRSIMQDFLDNTDESYRVEIDVTDLDKSIRKNIHTISKSVKKVISQTDDRDKRKILIISKNEKKSSGEQGAKIRRDRRINCSQCGGEYLYFVLHKVNLDTMDALNQLAHNLRLNASILGYAGTKDRRARTSQWVSLKRGNPYLIEKATKSIKGAYAGNFKFAETQLKLGMLKGNRFSIALRNVIAEDEAINSSMISLRDNGFINYFGLQRFGSIFSIPTYEIGKALLQGNWKSAVDLILKPRDGEQDDNLAEARKIYEETKDAKKALKKIERSDKIEAKLLNGISKCGESNLHGALDYIPRNTSLIYLHSYQSLIWNIIVSRRIKEFGKKPIVGDLVYRNVAEDKIEEIVEMNTEKEVVESENKDEIEIGDNIKVESGKLKKGKMVEKEDVEKIEESLEVEIKNKKLKKDDDVEMKEGKMEKKEGVEKTKKSSEVEIENEELKEDVEMKEDKKEEIEDVDKIKKSSEVEFENKELKKEDDVEMKEEKLEQISEVKVEHCESKDKNHLNVANKIIQEKESVMKIEKISQIKTNNQKLKDVKDSSERKTENIKLMGKTGEEKRAEGLNKLPEVKILKEEDLPNYTLADIIMPMPGWKVIYPPYAKSWYDEILGKDGLDSDLTMNSRKYTLCGSYRRILQLPADLSWRIMHYNDRNAELIPSDLDEMRKNILQEETSEAKYKALIIKMSLQSSTYATSALREILKVDMSSQTQAAQSAAHV